MTAALTASFILKLEDQLSGGIGALSKKLEALARLGRQVSVKGLDGAGAALKKVGADADGAARKIDGIGRAARTAMAATVVTTAATSGALSLQPIDHGLIRMGQLRGGAAAVRREFAGIVGQARHLGQEMRHVGEAGLVAFGTGFGLLEPIKKYAEYENTLRHIAITAGVERGEIPKVVAELSQQYNRLAVASGQSAEKVAESANFLITTGIGRANVDKLLPLVARAATAYNSPIGDSVQAIFSLKENLHVADQDMPGTLSAMALSGKEGHFSFSDMSRFLPDVAPLAANSGLKGAGGSRQLMAMLETSRRNAGTSGEAETNVRDFLSHLFGDDKRGLAHQFKAYGVDLNRLLLDAEKKGISAPEAVIEQVRRMTTGKTDVEKNLILGKLFHNQQSAQFARGWLADMEYYLKLKEKLGAADAHTIDHDFDKASDAPAVKLRRLMEMTEQVVRRFGDGFAPLLDPLTNTLSHVIALMDRLDQSHPGAINTVVSWTGSFLALTAVLGLAIPVVKLMGSGLMLLLTPFKWLWAAIKLLIPVIRFLALTFALLGVPVEAAVVLAVAAIALLGVAVYELYQHWDGVVAWFGRLWERVATLFSDFTAWVGAWVGAGVQAAIGLFKSAWGGLTGFFTDLIDQWTAPFNAFIDGIERRLEALRNSPIGRALGMGDGAGGGPAAGKGGVEGDGFAGAPDPAVKPRSYLDDGAGGGGGFAPTTPRAAADVTVRVQVDQAGRVAGVDSTGTTPDTRVIDIDRGDLHAGYD